MHPIKKTLLTLLLLGCISASGQPQKIHTPSSFNGDFTEWMKTNVTFPKSGLRDKLTGIVDVSFRVETTGKINNLRAEGMTEYFREAARQGLKKLTMIPAKDIGGHHIASDAQLSIDFSLLLDSATLAGMTFVEQYEEPVFNGSSDPKQSPYYAWLDREFKIPPSLKKESVCETIRVSFRVGEDGKMTDLKALCRNGELTAEIGRLLGECPPWVRPAMVNGKPHAVTVDENIAFIYDNGPKSPKPYLVRERMPVFQGGDLTKFREWVMSQIRYPAECARARITGAVVVSFVVEKDGSLGGFTVLKTPHAQLTEEVLRVYKISPRWTPGVQNGVPVRGKYTLPVMFKTTS